MATINIMLSFVFAWKYGAIGISISICIAYIIRTIGLNIIFRKRLALDIRRFFSETFAKMGAGLVIVIVLSLALKNFIQLNGLIGLVLKTILFIFIYCIYSTVVVNDEEKIMVKKLLNIKKQS